MLRRQLLWMGHINHTLALSFKSAEVPLCCCSVTVCHVNNAHIWKAWKDNWREKCVLSKCRIYLIDCHNQVVGSQSTRMDKKGFGLLPSDLLICIFGKMPLQLWKLPEVHNPPHQTLSFGYREFPCCVIWLCPKLTLFHISAGNGSALFSLSVTSQLQDTSPLIKNNCKECLIQPV